MLVLILVCMEEETPSYTMVPITCIGRSFSSSQGGGNHIPQPPHPPGRHVVKKACKTRVKAHIFLPNIPLPGWAWPRGACEFHVHHWTAATFIISSQASEHWAKLRWKSFVQTFANCWRTRIQALKLCSTIVNWPIQYRSILLHWGDSIIMKGINVVIQFMYYYTSIC